MSQTTFDLLAPTSVVGKVTGIRSVEVRQREFQHDLLTATVYGYQANQLALRTGDPISASLTYAGAALYFPGYVHSVVPLDRKGPMDRRCLVHVIGASFPMKEAKQRAWANTSVSTIAAQIAQEHRLAAEIETHPFIFEMITQPGISDFALLVKLAKRVGYTFFVSGTTLVFRGRGFAMTTRRDYAESFIYRDRTASATALGEVLEFEPKLGEINVFAEGTKAQRSVFGVDPRGAQVLQSHHTGSSGLATRTDNKPGLFTAFEPGMTPHSLAEAEALNTGSDDRARYHIRARAELLGRTRVRQGAEIFLEGLPSDYSGYWTALSCLHRFEKDQYFLDVDLGTDSLGAATYGAKPTSFRPAATVASLDPARNIWMNTVRGGDVLTSPGVLGG